MMPPNGIRDREGVKGPRGVHLARIFKESRHNLFEVEDRGPGFPRVARCSQPWAGGRNPFGIKSPRTLHHERIAAMAGQDERKVQPRGAPRRFRFFSVLAGAVFLLLVAQAQVLGPIKGFKLADPLPPPHENEIKSLLEAATAFRLPDEQVALTNAVLRTFRENGQPDLTAKAAYALCNLDAHSASSPGPLQAATADGKFSIVGEGFLWQQTNATLVISNRVRTEVQPDLKIWSDQLVYWA